MYNLSIELLEALADRLQVKERSPNFETRIYRKAKNNTFENLPNKIENIQSIDIDFRWNMAVDEANIVISNTDALYSSDYSHLKKFRGIDYLPISPFHNVIEPFSRIEIDLGYGDELRRKFTGQIQKVRIDDVSQIISISCQNEFRKLLKPIDPISCRKIVYKNKTAILVVTDLLNRAGVQNIIMDAEEIAGNDFSINNYVVDLGTSYKDAINGILEIMGHRIFGNRLGFIQIKKIELYEQKSFHHWEFSDYVNLTEGGYDIDPSIFRNRIIIMGSKGWKAYEDPFLINYCNGEVISASIEVPWAQTDEQMQFAADNYFMQMRRKLRRITVGVIGNPSMDIGDLVKMEMFTSTATGKYMIVGISSKFSEAGYIDIVDLEYVSKDVHIAVEAAGEYKEVKTVIDENGEHEEQIKDKESTRTKLIETAKKYLDTPYQWGGCISENPNHFGFDCSHFVYAVLKEHGLIDSYKVAEGLRQWSTPITKEELLPGDLIFYLNNNGRAIHVTMFLENNKSIGASGGDSSTTTVARARQRNAKVKIGNAFYGAMQYGRIPGI